MRTTRRSAVTASGAAALALTGCTGNGSDSSGPSTSTSSTTASVEAAPDPDRVALDQALAITLALVADLDASAPRIDSGGLFAGLHAEHRSVILAAVEDLDVVPPDPGTVRPLTARRLRQRELAAQRRLAELAGSAESGGLARLLASMSAGIAARLAQHTQVPQ